MKHALFPSIIALFSVGAAGCNTTPKYEVINKDVNPYGCWVDANIERLPTPKQAVGISEKIESDRPAECPRPMPLHLRLFLPDSHVTNLSVQNWPDGGTRIIFDGKDIPRESWGDADTWGAKYCDEHGVLCLSRISAAGDVTPNPSAPSLPFGAATPMPFMMGNGDPGAPRIVVRRRPQFDMPNTDGIKGGP